MESINESLKTAMLDYERAVNLFCGEKFSQEMMNKVTENISLAVRRRSSGEALIFLQAETAQLMFSNQLHINEARKLMQQLLANLEADFGVDSRIYSLTSKRINSIKSSPSRYEVGVGIKKLMEEVKAELKKLAEE